MLHAIEVRAGPVMRGRRRRRHLRGSPASRQVQVYHPPAPGSVSNSQKPFEQDARVCHRPDRTDAHLEAKSRAGAASGQHVTKIPRISPLSTTVQQYSSQCKSLCRARLELWRYLRRARFCSVANPTLISVSLPAPDRTSSLKRFLISRLSKGHRTPETLARAVIGWRAGVEGPRSLRYWSIEQFEEPRQEGLGVKVCGRPEMC